MTVKLTGNFLATARCLIFQDGNGIAWTFNSLTNTLEADYSGAGSEGSANPSAAKVGLSAVNGSATTWLRSDATHALDVTIAPTWTGAHAFTNTVATSGSPLTSATTRPFTGLANFKSSTTTSNNTTLAADASLTVAANETGWYTCTVSLFFFEATAGTGGIKMDLQGGTVVATNVTCVYTGFINGTFQSFAPSSGSTLAATGGSFATINTSANWATISVVLQVTTPGTLAFRWAQNSLLAADPTSLTVGSNIVLTKIG